MRHRDTGSEEGVPAGSTRGSPYKSTTKRGDIREAGRAPADTQRLPTAASPGRGEGEVAVVPPPLPMNSPGSAGTIPHQIPAGEQPDRGEDVSSRTTAGGGLAEGIPPPVRPKVVFGGPVRSGGPPPVAVVLILASIAILGIAAILLGRAIFSPGRSIEEARSPEGEAASPPEPASTGSTEPENRRIGYGKFEVVVPLGWSIASQSPNSLALRNPTTDAYIEIHVGYGGSHADLRPRCRTAAPSPLPGTATPSPTPSAPIYDVLDTSTVPVGSTSAEIQEGNVTCPEGDFIQFATVLVRDYSIGISYRGDPTDLRFMLPDLIVEV